MPVPSYTDVSRFRAPYLNAYFSGYGADDPPPPPPPPPPGTPPPPAATPAKPSIPPVTEMTTKNEAGYRVLKPVWKDVLTNVLTQWIVGPQETAMDLEGNPTGGFTVSLRRATPDELAAAAKDPKVADALRLRSAHGFIQKEAGPGSPPPHRVVFIEDWTVMGLIAGAAVPGMPMRLFAINSDDPAVAEAKKPNGPILLAGSPGAPSEAKETDGRSVAATVGIAAAAIAVVGGVYLVTRKKGAAPPRMEG